MSVEVTDLTKIYQTQKALDQVSFRAEPGKITGFLGPNGAGKSTTMKILTGYISASSGSAFVNAINVNKNPLKVKSATGYLPEHNPLYLDMYVKEYLGFIGEAYRLKDVKKRVSEMIDLCGLHREQHKRIAALSKGYRQRVGLAQALIHDPEVLILDEPTSGLDPNQLVEIRKVIKNVSTEKTVILSTHIMQEVEILCDQAIIINKGKVVANDEVKNLKSSPKKETKYKVEFDEPIAVEVFQQVGLSVSKIATATYEISADKDPRRDIMQVATNHNFPLVTMTKVEETLESVFQNLTKEDAGNS